MVQSDEPLKQSDDALQLGILAEYSRYLKRRRLHMRQQQRLQNKKAKHKDSQGGPNQFENVRPWSSKYSTLIT